MKAGDLIFWHGRNTIALVIYVDGTYPSELWVCLFDEDGITHDYLEEGLKKAINEEALTHPPVPPPLRYAYG